MSKKSEQKIVVYQAKSGGIELRGDFSHETVWATLDQIADLFGRDKSVISRHLKRIFSEGELKRASVVAKNAICEKCILQTPIRRSRSSLVSSASGHLSISEVLESRPYGGISGESPSVISRASTRNPESYHILLPCYVTW